MKIRKNSHLQFHDFFKSSYSQLLFYLLLLFFHAMDDLSYPEEMMDQALHLTCILFHSENCDLLSINLYSMLLDIGSY